MIELKTPELLSELDKINYELNTKLKKLSELLALKESEDKIKFLKCNELSQTKRSCLLNQSNQENLTERNVSLRNKFHIIDDILKTNAETIAEEAKNIFRQLGVKIIIEESKDVQNLIEVKIEFSERKNYIKLIYDSNTDDFDLFEIFPEHNYFDIIRTFLRRTGDVQGLMCSFRTHIMNHENTQ